MSEAFQELGYSAPVIKPDRRTKWPADMVIPEKWIADGYAIRKRHGLSRIKIALEAENFINRNVAKGEKYVDWHRAWLNWLTKPWCVGVPEDEPACKTNADLILAAKAKVWAKGLRTQSINLHDVKRAVELGLMTREQARKLGFVVALD